MKTQYEMLEAKLNAAHAVITEVQSLLRLMRDNGLVSFKDENVGQQTLPTAQGGAVKNVHQMPEPSSSPRKEENGNGVLKQGELFDLPAISLPKSSCPAPISCAAMGVKTSSPSSATTARPTSKNAVRHRGDPAVDRKAALANYREIVKGREIIHLADVNRIFGYNESTSGHFVRDAVTSGRLATIDYGKSGRKFLAKAVREFIRAYFDTIEGKSSNA